MTALRNLLILALIAVPVYVGAKYVPHHEGSSPFITLYKHLVPEKLVLPSHGDHGDHAASTEPAHYLLEFPLPDAFAAFDMDDRPGVQLVLTNLAMFQIAAVLLILVCFSGVPRYVRTGRGDWLTRVLAGFVLWIRDEMVFKVMGPKTGLKFLPYFLSLFFFILFMNLLGLVPGGATATASIFVTGALAIVVLLSMIIGGMIAQGPFAYVKNLVPHVPIAIWPLMFVVELIGLVVKPFALMVRLFANMSGGHMVVLSFMGLIFFFGSQSTALGFVAAPIGVAFAVFIMIIESFVALLQAYVFTQLSILFIQASIHPEH